MKSVGAIILAAGKGKRMNSTTTNKVALPLGGKPMIRHAVEVLEQLHLSPIIVVVGHAYDSVEKALDGTPVLFAMQQEQLGTANALLHGLKKLPDSVEDVLVIQGDDSALYTPELITDLVSHHQNSFAAVTLLTVVLDNPHGLGRIIRSHNKIIKIVEEKDATDEEKNIHEINAACYVFKRSFLDTYLPLVSKSPVTGEYYLTTLIDLGIASNEKIETVSKENALWRGVNTLEELKEAEKLFSAKI